MGSLFPLRDSVSADEDRDPRLVDLDEDTADEVFDALSSRTTRMIFLALHDQPQAASDLADVTDTSVQNVQYHLEKLTEAELIEVVDTWYSERGSEMRVYAPTDESLVLYAGRDKQSSLRTILRRLVGAVGTLVPASVGVGWLAGRNDGGQPSGFEDSLADEPTGAAQSDDQATTGAEDGEPSGADGGDADAIGGDGDADTDADTSAEDDTGGMEIQGEQFEDATADGDTTDLSEISEIESLSETVDGEIDISSDDLLIEAGNQSLNATARLRTSANETTLTIDPADLTALTTQSSGADPGVVAGLAFFFGGLFVMTVAVVWSVWW